MKPGDQIKALAELDGYRLLPSDYTEIFYPGGLQTIERPMWHQTETNPLRLRGLLDEELPKYLDDYNAIMPLVRKQSAVVRFEMHFSFSGKEYYTETPDQLAEALLRVTGKWVES